MATRSLASPGSERDRDGLPLGEVADPEGWRGHSGGRGTGIREGRESTEQGVLGLIQLRILLDDHAGEAAGEADEGSVADEIA